MVKQTTETGRSLIPEDHYDAMINSVKRKEIKEFIIYEWSFEALVNDKPFYFSISLFSSQMAELLRALGANEVSKNKFEWDDEEVVGKTISFTLAHIADKKGVVRETLSDIKLLTNVVNNNPDGVKSPEEIIWNS